MNNATVSNLESIDYLNDKQILIDSLKHRIKRLLEQVEYVKTICDQIENPEKYEANSK